MKQAFVIGHPVRHSRSPLLHTAWIEGYGIDARYDAIDVAPAALPAFIDRLRHGEFVGGNVTIPHKEAVLELCDVVDPLARTIGAVNTLVAAEGRVHGFNTDGAGFLGNLDQQAPGWSSDPVEVIVLGAGGAARAVLVALAQRSFAVVHVLNRTSSRAVALADQLPGPFAGGPLAAFADLAPRARLVVNTTSVGMQHTSFETLPLQLLPPDAIVSDIVYVPLVTPLLKQASLLGLRTVDGLGMLLHQAVPGFEAWFGLRPQVTPELRARLEATL